MLEMRGLLVLKIDWVPISYKSEKVENRAPFGRRDSLFGGMELKKNLLNIPSLLNGRIAKPFGRIVPFGGMLH